jgi:VRR-NUC domain
MAPHCAHPAVTLLNPWELLRKYVCDDCGAVMTCACVYDLAVHVLPHQTGWSVDPDTEERVAVTEQFANQICFDCRGVAPPAYPKAPHRGSASVVHRYYWHELWTRTSQAFLAWCRDRGLPLLDQDGRPLLSSYERQHPDEFARINGAVLAEVRTEHEARPRYDVSRPSDADILAASGVDVVDLPACYLEPAIDRKVLVMPVGNVDPAVAVSVEDYVAAEERIKGREVMFLESRPVQCLFGALMWLWVQDPADERGRLSFFGGRDGIGADENGMIACILPGDFGIPGHAVRRAEALEAHLGFLPDDTAELLWAYDYWLDPSRPLRQYLWAYTPEDEDRARVMIDVLGAPQIKLLLRFLAEDYWRRYCGWPDLLTWRPTPTGAEDPALIEVKSSGDRLSEDQRTWIGDNAATLRLPFRLVKVHRTERLRRG